MKLREVAVQNFRSIKQQVRLIVDPYVTVLVGANDHGKTNLLRAIRSLNDDSPIQPDDVNWDAEGEDAEIVWHFELSRDNAEILRSAPGPAGPPASPDQPVPPTDALANLRTQDVVFRRRTRGPVEVVEPANLSPEQAQRLLSLRPRIELFQPVQQVQDTVSRAQLDEPAFEFMKGLFIKADLWPNRDKVFTEDFVGPRLLEEASKQLTKILSSEWEQGKELQWSFRSIASGQQVRIYVIDPAIARRWTSPSHRSSGFTAFFTLSLTIFARTEASRAQSFIYLFDEPGTYLHPVAQINLQRVFQSLSEQNQLLYTTHSLFLVNKNSPSQNRVIQKRSAGTTIDQKPFSSNWKAVRESLGLLLSQNLLIAEHTLVVEGPSDPIYLLAVLSKLIDSDRIDVDLNQFSVMDAGDGANFVAMTKIMLAEGRTVVAMLDGDEHGKKIMAQLARIARQELKDTRLRIVPLPSGCSIEDLLPNRNLVIDAVIAAVDELTANEICTFGQEASIDSLRRALTATSPEKEPSTLGRRIATCTEDCFVQREAVSKVHVAFKYEEKLRELPGDELEIDEPLTKLLDRLVKALELPGRATERGLIVGE